MGTKTLLLFGFVTSPIVIVQTGLPQRYYFRFIRQFNQALDRRCLTFFGTRMNTNAAPNIIMSACDLKNLMKVLQINTNIEKTGNARLSGGIECRLQMPVMAGQIKPIEMAVGIN